MPWILIGLACLRGACDEITLLCPVFDPTLFSASERLKSRIEKRKPDNRRNKMIPKNSKKWLVILVSVGLMTGFQGAAFAANSSDWLSSLFGGQDASNNQNPPDQKQIQADQALAAQYQQAYQNDRQALTQAYRSGDRQNIQHLQSALNVDIGHLQANAQDLAKEGGANPNTVPGYNSYQSNSRRTDGRWENRGSYLGNNRPNRQWDNGRRNDYAHNNGYSQPNPGYRYDHWRHDANWRS